MYSHKYVRSFALMAAALLALVGCSGTETPAQTPEGAYIAAEVPQSVELSPDALQMEVANPDSAHMDDLSRADLVNSEELVQAIQKWSALADRTLSDSGLVGFPLLFVAAESGQAEASEVIDNINGGTSPWAAEQGTYTFEVYCYAPSEVGYTVRAETGDGQAGWVVAGTCGNDRATRYVHSYENTSAEDAIHRLVFKADEPAAGFALLVLPYS